VFFVMKIISWNVRGLGGSEKRREVSQLVREKKPFILCIQETKLSIIDGLVNLYGVIHLLIFLINLRGVLLVVWLRCGMLKRSRFGHLSILSMC
jgi:hypothetical protein